MEGAPKAILNKESSKRRESAALPEVVKDVDEASRRLDDATRLRVEQTLRGDDHFAAQLEQRILDSLVLDTREASVQGQSVRLLGVVHVPETLLQYRDRIEHSIANSSALVLEGAPEISGLYAAAFEQEIEQTFVQKGHTEREAKEWYRTNVLENAGLVFFHEMEQLAKKYGVPVVVADPYSGPDRMKKLVTEGLDEETDALRLRAAKMENGIALAWGGSLLAGLAFLGQSFHRREQARVRGHVNAQLSRRSFLTGSAALAATAALTPTTYSIEQETEALPSYNSAITDLAGYGFDDYRNIETLRAFEGFADSHRSQKPVTWIYGDRHVPALERYMRYPFFRDLKRRLYAPLRAVARPKLEEFAYSAEEDPQLDKGYTGRWERKI